MNCHLGRVRNQAQVPTNADLTLTMNDNIKDDLKPFPSLSQLLLTLPSSNTEYIPTETLRFHTEKGHMLDAGVISQHLSDDLKRVSWLESFPASYLKDLADARQRIVYQKGLLSYIRRLPLEILQSIFLMCLPEGFIEASPNAAPLLLCQICKYWRDVALSLPLLWASFKVRRFSTGTCSPAFPLAELWLERSKPMPLSICFPVDADLGCDPRPDDVWSLIRLSFQHLSRWKSVHMCLRDLLYYECLLPLKCEVSTGLSPMLENLELCFPPDSVVHAQVSDLGFRNLGDVVPMIWTSSPRLHTLTLNATSARHVLQILKTCPNIHDCEFHLIDDRVFMIPNERLILPHLHTLNIRARITTLNILSSIATPSLRKLTIEGEKLWSRFGFQDFIDQSSCSIEEFSMSNIIISPSKLLHALEHIGTAVKILRIHIHPRNPTVKPISDEIFLGIASYLLVPNLEVLDLGCDGMDPEDYQLFVEMIASRLGWEWPSQLGTVRSHSHSAQTLRKICLSADKDTAHMHAENIKWIKSLTKYGVDVKDDSAWRDYRIDGWSREIKIWPGSNRW